ncbi:MAG: YcxB family protein [Chitinophagaceae bacterium]|nr:MAG: YcxB family protein [Chitinophagaceae bacterium]
MLRIHFELTREDLKAYVDYATWTGPEHGMRRLTYYASCAFYSVIGSLMLVKVFPTSRPVSDERLWMMAGLAVLVGVGLGYLNMDNSLRKNVDRFMAFCGSEEGPGATELCFSAAGVQELMPLKETHYQWGAFTRPLELPGHIILVSFSTEAIVIPKRVLGATRLAELHRFLDECLPLTAQPELRGAR